MYLEVSIVHPTDFSIKKQAQQMLDDKVRRQSYFFVLNFYLRLVQAVKNLRKNVGSSLTKKPNTLNRKGSGSI